MEAAVNRSYAAVGLAFCLVLFAASIRLMPHPDNFVPITAVALFGGAMLPRRYAVAVPLIAMIATDLIIGLHDLIVVTWGMYALIALAGHVWFKRPTFRRGVVLALGSSIAFFVVTNFAVWVTSGMYAHTWAGLMRCYTLAVPFFRNTVAGDLTFTVTLFGLYALANRLVIKESLQSAN